MAEFEELRQQLRDARAGKQQFADDVARARERVKRIETEQARLGRVLDPDNDEHADRATALGQQHAEALGALAEFQDAHDAAGKSALAAFQGFAAQTNPLEAVGKLSDQFPVLLMPVRLETRFKTVTDNNQTLHQLWVRVYPDDCWVDTFEETLSVTEVESARLYWAGVWQAGGVEAHERGAWRGLVGSHGSGRAAWIVANYEPLNPAEKPLKVKPTDVVLVVPTESALDATEGPAVAAFWPAVWLADGDATKEGQAFAALVAALAGDQQRAAELVRLYVPSNMSEQPQSPLTKADVETVSTAFVVFPKTEDTETKQRSWTRAPKVALMPDRLVLMAYKGSGAQLVVVGEPVPSPLIVGPDPSAPPGDQIRHEDGGLVLPDEMKWMVDFDRAVEVGMGFRVDLTPAQAESGFDRLLVLGVRLSADEEAGRLELESLIHHHRHGREGFAIVPQGTPTNNTEDAGSGFTTSDDPDASFDDLFVKGDLFEESSDWLDKKDGQWLAECLGIDVEAAKKIRHGGGADQVEARAMNMALWPSTLGYWMSAMMDTVFDRETEEHTRLFFRRYVSGRGLVPAVRIGKQPYGILPATAFSRMDWLKPRGGNFALVAGAGNPFDDYLHRLYQLLKLVDADWKKMADEGVKHSGSSGDAHKTLLDILGLHPTSVEYAQRYAESLEQLFNQLNYGGFSGAINAIIKVAGLVQGGTELLEKLGHVADEGEGDPDILSKFFFGNHIKLKGPLVDDRPLSEADPVRPYTPAPAKKNYIEWLIDAAKTSLEAVRAQSGFTDNKPPIALLYILLRHALEEGYYDVSYGLHLEATLFDAAGARAARRESPFIHVKEQAALSESRYQLLYKSEPAITGNDSLFVSDFITSKLGLLDITSHLNGQLEALECLKQTPTARLERAFAEHVDCCAYRFDAWLLGLVHHQLTVMRNVRDGVNVAPKKGIYLGAYAWLEEVRPENKVLTPAEIEPDLQPIFAGGPPLVVDNTNQGFIHAPSLNHAVAAAVLRNGFISNASPANRQTLAVNLTSERVRVALAVLEGIRGGQSLGALLGYQLERGLHDRHDLIEVDEFIYKLRKQFPLTADRINSTKTAADVPVEAVEARNVVDGLALVDHIRKTGKKTYPFGKSLPVPPQVEQAQINAVDAEVDRIVDIHDAVADLALAEGVYQAVQGNYDRVASTLDSYSRGDFPPEPDVVRTPASGTGLTLRVGLHLEAGANPAAQVGGIDPTPRANGEPALNLWLADVLPPLAQIGCKVVFLDATTNAMVEREVTMGDLGVQFLDLLFLAHDESGQAMTELDDRVVRFVYDNHSPRPDVGVRVRYMERIAASFTVFEVMPLARSLRRLALSSRPLRASDLTLGGEAEESQDETVFADKLRVTLARDRMQNLRSDLAAFLPDLEGPLADPDPSNGLDDIITNVDAFIQTLAALLSEAAGFGIPQTGWGFAYEWRQRQFVSILGRAAELVVRWDKRLLDYQTIVDEYNALPAGTSDDERFALLMRAETLISTGITVTLPALPDDFLADLDARRNDFEARRTLFDNLADTNLTSFEQLHAHVLTQLLPVDAFDATGFTLADEEKQAIVFVNDAANLVKMLIAELDRRLAASAVSLKEHDDAAKPVARVEALRAAARTLLGDEFVLIPEFTLAPAREDEFEKAFAAGGGGDLLTHLTANPDEAERVDFPVDDWLYGLARVRDKMRAWEQVVMYSGAFGNAEPELTPVQLPFTTGDRWLGLKFPPDYKLDAERLLYTAHFANPFQKSVPQCGLLLDEWAEVIPSAQATTGVTFHYDRPNCEPPQTMLLVTPADFTGHWRWDDLVDALNDTMALAKKRAVEPAHVEPTGYARFLPAAIMAATFSQLTISANLAINNNYVAFIKPD